MQLDDNNGNYAINAVAGQIIIQRLADNARVILCGNDAMAFKRAYNHDVCDVNALASLYFTHDGAC